MPVSSDSSEAYAAAAYAPAKAIRWNGWWFLAAVAPLLVLVVVVRLFHVQLHLGRQVGVPVAAATSVVLYGWSLLVLFAASRRRGLGSLDADFGWRARSVDAGLAAAAVVALFAVSLVIGPLARSFGPVTSNVHLTGDRFWDGVTLLVIPTLVAAPVEELLFRGLLMRWIRIWMIRQGLHRRRDGQLSSLPLHASVLLSAAVFAVAHLYEVSGTASIMGLELQTFALGVANGYLASRTGRLGAAVGAHGALNLIAAVSVLSR